MNWNNVTIGMLQQIAAYKTDNPIKRAAHDISVITGTPLEVINMVVMSKKLSLSVTVKLISSLLSQFAGVVTDKT